MNKFNPGDKVRFLNDVGGGTIVRIIDSKMALVAIEDGFEIPVMMHELIASEEQSRRNTAQEVLQKEILTKANEEKANADAQRREGLRRFAKSPEAEGFYLAFVPHEQQWILTGVLDVVLINNTALDAFYTFNLLGDKQIQTADNGLVKAFSKVTIETISREDLNNWCAGYVQAICMPTDSSGLIMPLHAPFDLKANRFYKEGSYVMTQVLGEKAILVQLQLLTNLKGTNALAQPSKFEAESSLPHVQVKKEKALIDKHKKNEGEAVVDLHIGELLDNIAGLSSHDMFKIQLDYFNKTLNSAIVNDYTKVTYIHGVGNGVLKNAIIKALENFEGVNNRMASMSKFGVGAIDVMIRDKD